jgi:hypothetical protein
MDKVAELLEKIAAGNKKTRKRKPRGGRKPKNVYAPDMSKGAPGTKPKSSASKPSGGGAAKPRTDLVKVPKAAKPKMFTPKRLGLIAAGAAGTGALVHKIRSNMKAQEKA